MIKKRRAFSKILSVLLILCLFISDTSAHALTVSLSPTKQEVPSLQIADLGPLQRWAQVETVFHGKKRNMPIILMRDSHGDVLSQKNTFSVLQELAQQSDFKRVLLEGAQGDLDPTYFHFHPDKETNLSIAERLLDQGHLHGAEYFLINESLKGKGQAGQGSGLEDLELYHANLKYFRRLKKSESVIEGYLGDLQRTFDRVLTNRANPDLRQLISERGKFMSEKYKLSRYLDSLNDSFKKKTQSSLDDASQQLKYPSIVRWMQLKKLESKLNKNDLEVEIKAFESKQANLLKKNVMTLWEEIKNDLLTKVSTGKADKSLRTSLEKLDQLTNYQIEWEAWPNMRDHAAWHVFQQEIDAQAITEETGALYLFLGKELAKTELEEDLFQVALDLEKMNKLLNLSLSPQEYQEIQQRRRDFMPKQLEEQLRSMRQHKTNASNEDAIDVEQEKIGLRTQKVFWLAMLFYQKAWEREQTFINRILSEANSLGDNRIAVFTGGFHTAGIIEALKQAEISFVSVRPKGGDAKESKATYEKSFFAEAQVEQSHLMLFSQLMPHAEQIRAGGLDYLEKVRYPKLTQTIREADMNLADIYIRNTGLRAYFELNQRGHLYTSASSLGDEQAKAAEPEGMKSSEKSARNLRRWIAALAREIKNSRVNEKKWMRMKENIQRLSEAEQLLSLEWLRTYLNKHNMSLKSRSARQMRRELFRQIFQGKAPHQRLKLARELGLNLSVPDFARLPDAPIQSAQIYRYESDDETIRVSPSQDYVEFLATRSDMNPAWLDKHFLTAALSREAQPHFRLQIMQEYLGLSALELAEMSAITISADEIKQMASEAWINLRDERLTDFWEFLADKAEINVRLLDRSVLETDLLKLDNLHARLRYLYEILDISKEGMTREMNLNISRSQLSAYFSADPERQETPADEFLKRFAEYLGIDPAYIHAKYLLPHLRTLDMDGDRLAYVIAYLKQIPKTISELKGINLSQIEIEALVVTEQIRMNKENEKFIRDIASLADIDTAWVLPQILIKDLQTMLEQRDRLIRARQSLDMSMKTLSMQNEISVNHRMISAYEHVNPKLRIEPSPRYMKGLATLTKMDPAFLWWGQTLAQELLVTKTLRERLIKTRLYLGFKQIDLASHPEINISRSLVNLYEHQDAEKRVIPTIEFIKKLAKLAGVAPELLDRRLFKQSMLKAKSSAKRFKKARNYLQLSPVQLTEKLKTMDDSISVDTIRTLERGEGTEEQVRSYSMLIGKHLKVNPALFDRTILEEDLRGIQERPKRLKAVRVFLGLTRTDLVALMSAKLPLLTTFMMETYESSNSKRYHEPLPAYTQTLAEIANINPDLLVSLRSYGIQKEPTDQEVKESLLELTQGKQADKLLSWLKKNTNQSVRRKKQGAVLLIGQGHQAFAGKVASEGSQTWMVDQMMGEAVGSVSQNDTSSLVHRVNNQNWQRDLSQMGFQKIVLILSNEEAIQGTLPKDVLWAYEHLALGGQLILMIEKGDKLARWRTDATVESSIPLDPKDGLTLEEIFLAKGLSVQKISIKQNIWVPGMLRKTNKAKEINDAHFRQFLHAVGVDHEKMVENEINEIRDALAYGKGSARKRLFKLSSQVEFLLIEKRSWDDWQDPVSLWQYLYQQMKRNRGLMRSQQAMEAESQKSGWEQNEKVFTQGILASLEHLRLEKGTTNRLKGILAKIDKAYVTDFFQQGSKAARARYEKRYPEYKAKLTETAETQQISWAQTIRQATMRAKHRKPKDEVAQSLGNDNAQELKQLRQALGLSVEQWANWIQVETKQIREWENLEDGDEEIPLAYMEDARDLYRERSGQTLFAIRKHLLKMSPARLSQEIKGINQSADKPITGYSAVALLKYERETRRGVPLALMQAIWKIYDQQTTEETGARVIILQFPGVEKPQFQEEVSRDDEWQNTVGQVLEKKAYTMQVTNQGPDEMSIRLEPLNPGDPYLFDYLAQGSAAKTKEYERQIVTMVLPWIIEQIEKVNRNMPSNVMKTGETTEFEYSLDVARDEHFDFLIVHSTGAASPFVFLSERASGKNILVPIQFEIDRIWSNPKQRAIEFEHRAMRSDESSFKERSFDYIQFDPQAQFFYSSVSLLSTNHERSIVKSPKKTQSGGLRNTNRSWLEGFVERIFPQSSNVSQGMSIISDYFNHSGLAFSWLSDRLGYYQLREYPFGHLPIKTALILAITDLTNLANRNKIRHYIQLHKDLIQRLSIDVTSVDRRYEKMPYYFLLYAEDILMSFSMARLQDMTPEDIGNVFSVGISEMKDAEVDMTQEEIEAKYIERRVRISKGKVLKTLKESWSETEIARLRGKGEVMLQRNLLKQIEVVLMRAPNAGGQIFNMKDLRSIDEAWSQLRRHDAAVKKLLASYKLTQAEAFLLQQRILFEKDVQELSQITGLEKSRIEAVLKRGVHKLQPGEDTASSLGDPNKVWSHENRSKLGKVLLTLYWDGWLDIAQIYGENNDPKPFRADWMNFSGNGMGILRDIDIMTASESVLNHIRDDLNRLYYYDRNEKIHTSYTSENYKYAEDLGIQLLITTRALPEHFEKMANLQEVTYESREDLWWHQAIYERVSQDRNMLLHVVTVNGELVGWQARLIDRKKNDDTVFMTALDPSRDKLKIIRALLLPVHVVKKTIHAKYQVQLPMNVDDILMTYQELGFREIGSHHDPGFRNSHDLRLQYWFSDDAYWAGEQDSLFDRWYMLTLRWQGILKVVFSQYKNEESQNELANNVDALTLLFDSSDKALHEDDKQQYLQDVHSTIKRLERMGFYFVTLRGNLTPREKWVFKQIRQMIREVKQLRDELSRAWNIESLNEEPQLIVKKSLLDQAPAKWDKQTKKLLRSFLISMRIYHSENDMWIWSSDDVVEKIEPGALLKPRYFGIVITQQETDYEKLRGNLRKTVLRHRHTKDLIGEQADGLYQNANQLGLTIRERFFAEIEHVPMMQDLQRKLGAPVWPNELFKNVLDTNGMSVELAMHNGKLVGWYAWQLPVNDSQSAEIMKIYLDPEVDYKETLQTLLLHPIVYLQKVATMDFIVRIPFSKHELFLALQTIGFRQIGAEPNRQGDGQRAVLRYMLPTERLSSPVEEPSLESEWRALYLEWKLVLAPWLESFNRGGFREYLEKKVKQTLLVLSLDVDSTEPRTMRTVKVQLSHIKKIMLEMQGHMAKLRGARTEEEKWLMREIHQGLQAVERMEALLDEKMQDGLGDTRSAKSLGNALLIDKVNKNPLSDGKTREINDSLFMDAGLSVEVIQGDVLKSKTGLNRELSVGNDVLAEQARKNDGTQGKTGGSYNVSSVDAVLIDQTDKSDGTRREAGEHDEQSLIDSILIDQLSDALPILSKQGHRDYQALLRISHWLYDVFTLPLAYADWQPSLIRDLNLFDAESQPSESLFDNPYFLTATAIPRSAVNIVLLDEEYSLSDIRSLVDNVKELLRSQGKQILVILLKANLEDQDKVALMAMLPNQLFVQDAVTDYEIWMQQLLGIKPALRSDQDSVRDIRQSLKGQGIYKMTDILARIHLISEDAIKQAWSDQAGKRFRVQPIVDLDRVETWSLALAHAITLSNYDAQTLRNKLPDVYLERLSMTARSGGYDFAFRTDQTDLLIQIAQSLTSHHALAQSA